MKIMAAQRLMSSYADTEKARAYLESLGIHAGKLQGRMHGIVMFHLGGGQLEPASKALSKRFGAPTKTDVLREWKVAKDRFIRIQLTPKRSDMCVGLVDKTAQFDR